MSDSGLKATITSAMKESMRARDKVRLGAIRLILSEVKRIEVDERIELDDAAIIEILVKSVKQRKDSIQQYEAANREDLAAQERSELALIETYLPTALSDEELDAMLEEAVAATSANSIKDMGKLMGWLRPHIQGRADMGELSAKVKARLTAA